MDRGQLIIEAQKKATKRTNHYYCCTRARDFILKPNLAAPPRNELENLFGANLEKDGDNVSHTSMEEEKWP